MPQNASSVTIAKTGAGAQTTLNADGTGALVVNSGGTLSKLNVSAAAVIKTGKGKAGRVVIIAPGSTSGAFTFNDCATVGAASAANTIWTLPYNAATNIAGATFDINFPVTTGLVLSAVPGAGSPIIAIAYS